MRKVSAQVPPQVMPGGAVGPQNAAHMPPGVGAHSRPAPQLPAMLVSLWVQAAPSAPGGGAGTPVTDGAGVAAAVGAGRGEAGGVAAGAAFLPEPLQAVRARTQETTRSQGARMGAGYQRTRGRCAWDVSWRAARAGAAWRRSGAAPGAAR